MKASGLRDYKYIITSHAQHGINCFLKSSVRNSKKKV